MRPKLIDGVCETLIVVRNKFVKLLNCCEILKTKYSCSG